MVKKMNKIYNKICFLKVKRKAKKYGFPIIKVTEAVIEKFRDDVKDNENKSDIEIIKKINRDMYSGQQIYKNNGTIKVAYGYLHISYDKKLNIINDINNKYRGKKCGRINQEIKAELNKIYGLEDK